MINIHSFGRSGHEVQCAHKLAQMAASSDAEYATSPDVQMDIFPGAQCYGQAVRDIDILVFFADYRPDRRGGAHSLCAVVEVKSHQTQDIEFMGAQCGVRYNGKLHNVSAQSQRQLYAVKNYITAHKVAPPFISNVIWLTGLSGDGLPSTISNIMAADATWDDFVRIAAKGRAPLDVKTFTNRPWMRKVMNIFGLRITPSRIDKKRMAAITKDVISQHIVQYHEKLGSQLLLVRGRAGTGKTMRLLNIGYYAMLERKLRVIFLTYNKSLVADVKRLFALMLAPDGAARASMQVDTIHRHIYWWLRDLGIVNEHTRDFLENYADYKAQAMQALASRPQGLMDSRCAYDLVLVDESQDWPADERDFIYAVYGAHNTVLADGVDQFVREGRADWTIGASATQSIFLRKSLRLKTDLCTLIVRFASLLGMEHWSLDIQPEVSGGKIIVVTGQVLESEHFFRRVRTTSRSQGNDPVDMLYCVPPSWVKEVWREKESRNSRSGKSMRSMELASVSLLAEAMQARGFKVWDGVDYDERTLPPPSNDHARIIQYDSCRGMEGWTVFCFALDEFHDYKRRLAPNMVEATGDIFFDQAREEEDFAKRWVMIPLTRAIDTLVLHVTDENSPMGGLLAQLHREFPDKVEWVSF